MGGWWGWTKWAFRLILDVVLLLAIYASVIQTRFECVVFSAVALVYFDVEWRSSLQTVMWMNQKVHLNTVFRRLSEQTGTPLDADTNEQIGQLAQETQEADFIFGMRTVAALIPDVIVLFNLFRAVFFWRSI